MKPTRLHSLDALRAIAMLGVIAYHVVHLSVEWRPEPHPVAEYFLWASHAWRMPVFFLVSGFFAAMLRERRGLREAWANRRRRLFYPLAAAFLTVWPLSAITVRAYAFLREGEISSLLSAAAIIGPLNHLLRRPSYFHLWFLVYLSLTIIIYFGLAARRKSSEPPKDGKPGPWLALIVVQALALSLMITPLEIDPPTRRLLAPGTFIYLGTFFAAGILLWRRYRAGNALPRDWRWPAALTLLSGALLYASPGFSLPPVPLAQDSFLRFALVPAFVLFANGGVYLALALANRFLARDFRVVRFLIEASFFTYLIHYPLLYLLGAALGTYRWTAGAEIATLGLLTYALCFLIFHYVVRGTALDRFLRGGGK